MGTIREKLEAALAKPLPDEDGIVHTEVFSPWDDVIEGIYGSYAAESDALFIGALEAVRDKRTFDYIEEKGFAGELILYILAGHRLTEYGSSPRGAWADPSIGDMWQPLIDKWRAYYQRVWGEALP